MLKLGEGEKRSYLSFVIEMIESCVDMQIRLTFSFRASENFTENAYVPSNTVDAL